MVLGDSWVDHAGMSSSPQRSHARTERRLLELAVWFARPFLLGMSMAWFVTALLLLVLAAL
jgi:hypothetical protein